MSRPEHASVIFSDQVPIKCPGRPDPGADPHREATLTTLTPDAIDALTPARHARSAALTRPAAHRIAALLEQAEGPMTAQEVADALGRHHTSVRAQLAALEEAGVAEGITDPPSGRGRPVRRYVLAADPGDREAVGHRELVRLLMGLVSGTGLGAEEMERFGEGQGWGIPVEGGGLAEVRLAFERLGFGPREEAGPAPADLVLARCPFADGVEAPGGELICVLHRGLARGIVARAAPGVVVTDLIARHPRRGGCRLVLEERPCPR
ncbi:MAG: HTH domain-containing protein [Thermoleophilia bacterium]|nr:HTH domain-containing protein [Thermoleophilia bacterium]